MNQWLPFFLNGLPEKEPADTVVRLLNKYFDVMVKEIIAQNGHIDKFIGDASWRYSVVIFI